MIIKLKNIQWREELASLLAKERCKFETDADLIITSTDVNEPRSQADWSKRINSILSTYFKKFEMKTIKYGDNDIGQLTRMIDQVRSNYQIDYTNELAKRQIFILGKKGDFQRFLATNAQAAALIDTFQASVSNDNIKPELLLDVNLANLHLFRSASTASASALQVPVIKHVRVSKPTYERHTRLILSLLERLKIHFNLYDYTIDIGQGRIELNGQAAVLSSSSAVLEQCLRNIVLKQLENYEINLLKCKNLPTIVEDSLKMLDHLVFDVSVRSFECNDEPGIFVTYFRNIPEIDSPGDSVYEAVKEYINANIEYIELDLSANQHLLLSPKWAKFKNEHLVNEKMAKNNYEIIVNSSANATGKCVIQLIGKKTYLHKIRDKIEHFIEENEIKTNNIRLDEDKIKYLSQIAVEEVKRIESLFEVSFDYDHVNLRVKNCRDQMFNIVQSEVNRIISQRVVKVFSTDLIPGIEKILEKNSPFYHDIKGIEKQTNTIIDIKPVSIAAKKNVNKTSVIPQNVPNYGNQIVKSLFVNQSIFNLQSGNITNSQTNVIVTVTNKDPMETNGMLARSILKKAGQGVLTELLQNKSTDVKITNSGSLFDENGVLSIFHCLLPKFSDIATSTMELKTCVTLCLTKLIEFNFTTITFPTLGMGLLGYGVDLVARVISSSVYEFLTKNTGCKLTVNLVIYEKDKASSNIFLNEFERLEKQSGQSQDIQHNKAQLKSDFNITSPSEEKYKQATNLLKKLIDEKYTKKETIGKDMLKYTSDDDIAKLIASISAKYKYCQISCRQRTVEFYGDKESVMEAKASMLGSITQMNNQNYTQIEETMKITRNIQWQYETDKSNEWKNFPLFLNSLIETKFSKKESKVTFVNEDNEEAVIYMNITPMLYQRGNKVTNVKRVDVTKINEAFRFPETWSSMSDAKDFELVDVANNSPEAQQVYADFWNKLSRKPLTAFKLQRIQNPCLYKQYMIHKEKFGKENRPCNEKTLFHGSTEDSLKKICRFGFNRSYCGKNGVAYGQGVYFAVNSAYSDGYAGVATGTQTKCMIRALVLVGDTIHGNSGMKTPPEKPGANRQFDSTCDGGQSIFVCYHDNQCYPEYLIYYQ